MVRMVSVQSSKEELTDVLCIVVLVTVGQLTPFASSSSPCSFIYVHTCKMHFWQPSQVMRHLCHRQTTHAFCVGAGLSLCPQQDCETCTQNFADQTP